MMKHMGLLALSLVLLLALVGCHTDAPAETNSDTVAATDNASEDTGEAESTTGSDTESSTESSTGSSTGSSTESTSESTEEWTEALEPIYVIDPDNAIFIPKELFSNASNCKATVITDEAEGQVFRLTVSNTAGGASVKYPSTYMDLAKLTAAMNGSVPNGEEYPYLVLKVRAVNVWDRVFCLYGGTDTPSAKPSSVADLCTAHVKDTDEWQYISFRLPCHATTLYLRFEYALHAIGECMDIAEIRFVKTEDEAHALCGKDVYPLQNPTLSEGDIRVVSYNIWVGGSTDDNLRADILRDFLDTYQPDSIGVQEDDPEWRAAFKDRFVFNDSYAGFGPVQEDISEPCMIFYRTDKYELVDSGYFWLSDTPDVPNSKYPDAIYARVCTWVHLRDRVTGREYLHFNTHLDHKSNDVRKVQVQALLAYIAEHFSTDVPMVLTGDFNSSSHTSANKVYALYKFLTGQRAVELSDGSQVTLPFSDSRMDAVKTEYMAGGTATMTQYFDKNSDKYNPEKRPIDYQFHSDLLIALRYRTELNDRDGTFMSDHLPVICDYSFRSSNSD